MEERLSRIEVTSGVNETYSLVMAEIRLVLSSNRNFVSFFSRTPNEHYRIAFNNEGGITERTRLPIRSESDLIDLGAASEGRLYYAREMR